MNCQHPHLDTLLRFKWRNQTIFFLYVGPPSEKLMTNYQNSVINCIGEEYVKKYTNKDTF